MNINKKSLLWLFTIPAIALVSMRFNIAWLAWISFVPLLLLLRQTNGFRGWASIFVLLQIAVFLQVVKIVTEPIPLSMALAFSIPMAAQTWVLTLIYEKTRRRTGEVAGAFLFAALMSAAEWASFYFSPTGSWGSMTYTQPGNLPLLQMTALFGITLPAFFIYLSSGLVAAGLSSPQQRPRLLRSAIASLLVFALFYLWGVIRIDAPAPSRHVIVAGITGDLVITPAGIPEAELLHKETQLLIDRTKSAIQRGARIIAWNEGATIIFKEEENQFVEQLRQLSANHQITLVAAYIVPIDGIHKFENKYRLVSNGILEEEYFKRQPVPGEGAIAGKRPGRSVDLGYATVAGAICYDFDFPTLGRALSRQRIDIAIVPSSDWRGIDPYHGQMAAVRAIEGGYALLRPVRGATSFATDQLGRIRATMNDFENNDGVMIASLPAHHIDTLYSQIGDLFPAALLILTILIAGRAWIGRT